MSSRESVKTFMYIVRICFNVGIVNVLVSQQHSTSVFLILQVFCYTIDTGS